MTVKEILENFCDNMGYSYSNNYSGRCMYGRECFSVTCESSTMEVLLEIADELHEAGVECVSEVLGRPETDSLGLGSVLYFPYADLDREVA